MRRLILMRHAKSSWAEAGQPDQDRPLNPRGRRDAAAMGAWLTARGYTPAAALVSAATRTQETWALLGFADAAMIPRPDLYHAAPETMLAALRQAPDVGTVLMLGHQPGIGAAARMLLAAPPQDAELARYPTTATSVIDFDVAGWSQVRWGAGALTAFATPKTPG